MLAAGEVIQVLRAGEAMALTNTGDTIEVVAPSGQVVNAVTYGPATEGEEIQP